METLDINQKGEYKIMNNDAEYEPTTYKEVKKRLQGKRIEDYTKEDTLDYYAYATEEEMNMPKVHKY